MWHPTAPSLVYFLLFSMSVATKKTILITGSTDGIGRLVAEKLSSLGHHVIIHGRSQARIKSAIDQVPGAFGVKADLSDLSQVQQMANTIKAKYEKIDVLINNAGVFKTSNPTLTNGQDVRFVVNTVAPFLLTKLLLETIPKKDGRIINLASAAQSSVNLRALRGEQSAGGDFPAYAQSKLALMAWSRHWALQLQRSGGPLMLSVNPGSMLATKMVKEGFGSNGRDINIGVNLLVSLALDAEHASHTGEYYDNDERQGYGPPHRDVLNPKICQAIVSTIEDLLP